ncbi:POTRA domain-containing protein [Spongiivirga citrea]|uniref:POTRA domain-containing protein n=1 Tax=Spongiivirga citrea TaxID=1481457 RepID=A0A6M0CKK5_9FLAO|nr:POTRA domain-containing protein [Spongiivirga citrea]NER18182.1 hypothetical protein [Spongiivirga citrea]
MKRLIVIMLLFCASITTAQEASITNINIEGLKRTDEGFLRRLIKVKPASMYDSIKIATDVEKLNRLPGIAKATSKLEKDASGNYQLTYEIVEAFTIIPGVRIATDNNDEFSYRLSAFEFNLFGKNQLIGGFYQNDEFNSYGFFWEAPYLFTNKFGFGVNYQNNVNQEPVFFPEQELNYRFDSKAFEVLFTYEFNFYHNAQIGAIISKEEYSFLPEQSEGDLPADKPANLSADRITFRGEYEYNDIDIDYQYVSGFRTLLDVRLVSGDESEAFLDSFFIGRNDFEYFQRVGEKGNWANRLRVAYASNNDNPFAPFTLDNQLNIRGVGNTVDRGTAALTLNTEYRHTFIEKGWFVLQGNAFIDAGTWRNPGQDISQLFDGTSTRLYPGLGVRFIHKRIFNAVFRLDYGFGVGDDATQGLVFGIGQYF